MDLTLLSDPEAYVSLATLTALEIVLGIDNLIFISILAGKVAEKDQKRIRTLGLSLALIMRLGLLFALSWVMGLTAPLFAVLGRTFSGRDLILLVGGLFLLAKSTHEIYQKLEVGAAEAAGSSGSSSFAITLLQILALDVVFSLDSVITAVGMAQHVAIMVTAMIIAVGVMLASANAVGEFVQRHPSMKILALAFLILIGAMLVAEGLGQHVSKGTIYFAMAFSLGIELLNMRFRRKRQHPIALNPRYRSPGGEPVASPPDPG